MLNFSKEFTFEKVKQPMMTTLFRDLKAQKEFLSQEVESQVTVDSLLFVQSNLAGAFFNSCVYSIFLTVSFHIFISCIIHFALLILDI